MKYLKKLLDELESVMDQVETELQRRVEETPGSHSCLSHSRYCINQSKFESCSLLNNM